MIEEPFRFVEAIANRREYIETQIATGSPIIALNYAGGILLFTLGRERQKIFEIYDRIAMGAIGHPGDIERLRMTAIELASTEGFTRSSGDVSLRRMANYSISPALKAAFEQIYGAPYLARVLFAELGPDGAQNTFLRVDYDGSIQSNGTPFSRSRQEYAVLGGTRASTEQMEKLLARDYKSGLDLNGALRLALDAWTPGFLVIQDDKAADELPTEATLGSTRREQLEGATAEVVVLESSVSSNVTFRSLTEDELRPLMEGNAS